MGRFYFTFELTIHVGFILLLSGFLCLQEEQNKGKPNWEHLSDELHVLLTVEDTANRAEAKLKKAVEEVKKLLVPAVSFFFIYTLCFMA